MNLKTLCLLAITFSTMLLGMDTTPEFERLRDALQNEAANPKTLFLDACHFGYLDIVSALLQRPSVQEYVVEGLYEAASNGNTKVVELLLTTEGVELEPSNVIHCLHLAADGGHVNTLNLLLGDKRIGRTGWQNIDMLKNAALNGHDDVVRMLHPKFDDHDLSRAWRLDARVARSLLTDISAGINDNRLRDLFADAVERNDIDMAKAIIDSTTGDIKHIVDLEEVCSRGRTGIAKLLINEPRMQNKIVQRYIAMTAYAGHLDLVKLLVAEAKNLENFSFKEALEMAIHEYEFDVVKYFLSIELSDEDINAGLKYACGFMKSAVTTRMVLAHPLCDPSTLELVDDINFVKRVQLATLNVDLAEDQVDIEMLNRIVEARQCSIKDDNGCTPFPGDDDQTTEAYYFGLLNDAVAIGNTEIVRKLISTRTSDDFKNEDTLYRFNDIFAIAVKMGHSEIVGLLIEKEMIDAGQFSYFDRFLKTEKAIKAGIRFPEFFDSQYKDLYIIGLLECGYLDVLESEKEYLTPDKISTVIDRAKSESNYRAYKILLGLPGCPKGLGEPNHVVNIVPLMDNLVYVKAGRIDKITSDIPAEDLDILYLYSRSEEMSRHIWNLKIEYIKQHHVFEINGESYCYISGSEKCRELIRTRLWPIVDHLVYFLLKLKPMKTSSLDKLLSIMMYYKAAGCTDSQLHLMADALTSTSFA